MHPILFKIGNLPIHTYGFLIAIGFLVAVQTARYLARLFKQDEELIMDLSFWLFIVGFLGARTLFVITRWESFVADPIAIFKVWEGGLVFYGGPLAAGPFAVWYLRKRKVSPWQGLDILLPPVAIAHMFGRFGCVAAGCCYGKPTGGDWGFKFHSDLVDRSLHGVPLHPTQMYEASALLILFVFLMYLARTRKFPGQVGLTYLLAYPIIRSIVEIYRGDTIRGFVIEGILSTSQFISLLVFVFALTLLIIRSRQLHQAPNKVRSK